MKSCFSWTRWIVGRTVDTLLMDTIACSAAQICDLDPFKLLRKVCFYIFSYAIPVSEQMLDRFIKLNLHFF